MAAAAAPPIRKDGWTPLKLASRRECNHDTRVFRFELAEGQSLDLPVASCVLVRATVGGEEVVRPYTPVSDATMVGAFELMIKVYAEGRMSRHIDSLAVGDRLDFKGPFLKVEYTPQYKRRIGMLAGGSGITPCLQILNEVVRNADDRTEVTLLYSNKTGADVLALEELERAAAAKPNVRVVHFITREEAPSGGRRAGRIGRAAVEEFMPPPADDSVVMLCGPPPFMQALSGDKMPDKSQGPVSGLLKEMGYTEAHVYKF